MIEEQRHHLEAVVANQGVLEGVPAPLSRVVGVGAVLEQVFGTLVVVPVVLSNQHEHEVLFGELAGFHQDLHGAEVVGFRRVIHGLFVVWIGTPLDEQTGQRRVVRHARRPVERRLMLGVLAGGPETGIRVRAGVQQRCGRPQERVAARGVEAEILRETEVVEGIPAVRRALRRDVLGVLRYESSDGGVVSRDRGGMDVSTRDLGMGGQDRLGRLQCPVPGRGLDEIGYQVHEAVNATAATRFRIR